MTSNTHRAWVEVDLGAISHNIRGLKKLVGADVTLLAVVKANAYGHGAVEVAKTALKNGASMLGVATLEEGIELRKAGIKAPILLLGPTSNEFGRLLYYNLEPTLYDRGTAAGLSEYLAGRNRSLKVHIKLDTGMGRLGVSPQEARSFVQYIENLPCLHVVSVYSHLATAEEEGEGFAEEQHRQYQQILRGLEKLKGRIPYTHIANTAAALGKPAMRENLVRVGLATYGLYPHDRLKKAIDLRPALSVKSRISFIKKVPPGTSVSYGRNFIAQRETLVATISIGYADGLPRAFSNNFEVLIRGRRIPLIGNVTMDQCMADVSRIPDATIGDEVVLLGIQGEERITAEDWAEKLHTINYEVVCSFKVRLPRVFKRK